ERDGTSAPVVDRVALEQLVEAHVAGRRRADDSPKRIVEPRRKALGEGDRLARVASVIRAQRQEPVHLACAGAGDARFEPAPEVLGAARTTEVLDDIARDAAN